MLNNCKDKGGKLGRIAGRTEHQAGGGRQNPAGRRGCMVFSQD